MADFDVATGVTLDYSTADGLGNAANALMPCVTIDIFFDSFNSPFTISNLDFAHARTYNIYGFY